MTCTVLVIGLGNRYRGDDAAGLCVAAGLRALSLPGVDVIEHEGESIDLIDRWPGASLVVLIDAMASVTPPGTIQRFDAHLQPLPVQMFRVSTHALSLAEVIELARAMGALPPKLVVYGIAGASFATGERLSPEVRRAIADVSTRVLQEIATGSRSEDAGGPALAP